MHSIVSRIVQPKGRSRSSHQLAFVVVVVGGLIGYRPAWSQAGLVMAGLATERASPHLAPSLAPKVDGWHSMPGCRVCAQGCLPMSVRQPACIFVFLVPVVLRGCTALRSMSLQAAGPIVFAVPSSMLRGDQMPRSFNLCTSVCFLVMCRAAGLMGESPLGFCWLLVRAGLAT